MAARARFFFALATLTLVFSAVAAPTRNNDDSCDISVMPAATLLLPYFEVDVTNQNGTTTLFTITNASAQEQLASVTLWTDRGFKVIDFFIYLTGYDVQSINLYDVIARGMIAPEHGTGTEISPDGDFSDRNPRLDLLFCDELPGVIPQVYRMRMIEAFTLGRVPAFGTAPACAQAGGVHANATGYATIDVIRTCGSPLPRPLDYYGEVILWDNVLMGDYQQVDRNRRFAEGSPMVHIRAVPEGGTPDERRDTVPFPNTFYSRFQPADRRTFDARQPLPSTFAARWIDGGPGSYQTYFKIWRDGRTGERAACSDYARNVAPFVEAVAFDEDENPEGRSPTIPPFMPVLAATSMTAAGDATVFPRPTTGAIAGWMYLNLDADSGDGISSQSWVVTSMRAEGQFSADMEATALGNGCTPQIPASEIHGGTHEIGPAPNASP